ncbi:unnamed protein product [Aureobasidium pullulans]|nr:unnamed protein product [Aureobasidium pullulans]
MLFKSVALFSLPSQQREARAISQALSQELESMTLKAEKSEQNFSRMLRDAPIGMCMHRRDGHCVYVNDILLELLGMSKVNFFKAAEEGNAWREAVHEDDFETFNQTWAAAIETGKPMGLNSESNQHFFQMRFAGLRSVLSSVVIKMAIWSIFTSGSETFLRVSSWRNKSWLMRWRQKKI